MGKFWQLKIVLDSSCAAVIVFVVSNKSGCPILDSFQVILEKMWTSVLRLTCVLKNGPNTAQVWRFLNTRGAISKVALPKSLHSVRLTYKMSDLFVSWEILHKAEQ